MTIVARYRTLALAALVAAGVAGWTFAQPAPQSIAQDKMEIRFVSRQMDAPVEGKFRKFKATVAFDRAKLEQSRALVEIDMASIELGLEEAETEVKGTPWFDTAKYPTATFASGSVKPLGGNKYEVAGKLTIKGTTRDIVAPLTITPKSGGTHDVAGSLVIKRLDFKIGEGSWSGTDTVANEVEIKFKLSLPAAPAAK